MAEHRPTINVEQAFDPELRRRDQARMDSQMRQRPYQDVHGNVRHPDTDQVIDPDQYFQQQRDLHYETSQPRFEDMSAAQLAREVAKAEYSGNQHSIVYDVLLDKMAEQEAILKAKIQERESQTGENLAEEAKQVAVDTLLDRMIAGVETAKNEELARLQGDQQPAAVKQLGSQKRHGVVAKVAPNWTKTQSSTTNFSQSRETKVASDRVFNEASRPTKPHTLGTKTNTYISGPPKPKPAQPTTASAEQRRHRTPRVEHRQRVENQHQEATNAEYQFPGEQHIHYDADSETDLTQLAILVDQPGAVLDLNRHPKTKDPNDRKFLVTDRQGYQYFVTHDSIFDLENVYATAMIIEGENWLKIGEQPLSAITIGEKWQLPDGTATHARIDRVEMAAGIVDATMHRGNRGEDPFALNRQRIFKVWQDMRQDIRDRSSPAASESPDDYVQDQDASSMSHGAMREAGRALLTELGDMRLTNDELDQRDVRRKQRANLVKRGVLDAGQALLAELGTMKLTEEERKERSARSKRAASFMHDAGRALVAELKTNPNEISSAAGDEQDDSDETDTSRRRAG